MIITPLYAGLLALFYLILSARVVQLRGPGGPSLGDGGNPVLLRRIRAHANLAEYTPFILLMTGFLELSKFPPAVLHGLGITLLVCGLLCLYQALHAYAASTPSA
jgi:uncharacterized membrane protein YecN with MAPEG domain